MKNIHKIKENIHITSDEEIKEGGWHYNLALNSIQKTTTFDNGLLQEKIILTTDQDLIKDGVQAIDDEFLEWFVKNTSCEEVEVLFACRGLNGHTPIGEYKIIIPKEEPKQDLEKEMFELEQELDIPSHLRWHNSKPKQEKLEEYDAESYLAGIKSDLAQYYWCKKQERMYSEEEVLKHLNHLIMMPSSKLDKFTDDDEMVTMKWFEQFKKK